MKPLIMPIQRTREQKEAGCPQFIPFANIDTYEIRKQALANHDQTLERLAERVGMSPQEMYAMAHGIRGRDTEKILMATAIQWLILTAQKARDGE
jgi:hypothetical protein